MSIYRIRTVLSGWQGAAGLNTHYFSASATPTAAEASTVAGRVRAAWLAAAPLFNGPTTAQVQPTVDVYDAITGFLSQSFSITAPAVVAGSATGVQAPPQVALGIVWDTATILGGRRLKGRTFIAPLSTSIVNQLLPPASANTQLNAYRDALIGATPPLANPAVVWHRPVNGAGGGAFTILTGSPGTKWFSIRSRRD